ncbi:MAG TPA: hypothetical protein VGP46_10735 [Acidimicrobiales bacterium]|jgi:heme/copper-type cytochrome/quinol oxidase subunit 3|nr:hypothetical protein [Acidimicrobiales bacterium]
MSKARSEAEPGVHLLVSTPEENEYELRSAEGAMWTAGRLIIGCVAFAFASLAFAYFYLKSTNSENLWRPYNETAPTHLGAPIAAVFVAAALINGFGVKRLRRGSTVDWEVAGWTALVLGLVSLALQVFELTQLPFFPGISGYSSCFIGWAAMNITLLLVSCYWLETLLARSLRLRHAVAADGGASQSAKPVARLFRANLEGATHFWYFAAALEVFFWVLFYVI